MFIVVNKAGWMGGKGEHPICCYDQDVQTYDTIEDAADLQAYMVETYGKTIKTAPIYELTEVDPVTAEKALTCAQFRRCEAKEDE